jgi:hypothetical protein
MDAKRSRLTKASSAVAAALVVYGSVAVVRNRQALSERVERWMLEHMNPYASGPVRRGRS